jgi:SAM-dependent methyltransferase
MATTIDGAEYDTLAPAYDLLTDGYDYDRWIGELLRWAREHGLRGRRALDVACGTGKSFVPLLDAGFDVVGCDESRGMLAVAATKVPDPRAVQRHDMRILPVLGSFDLITCIDDALNHLLSEAEVRDALASMARNLAPGGLLVFDVNTLGTLRAAYSGVHDYEAGDWRFRWTGHSSSTAPSGCVASGTLAIDARRRMGRRWGWRRASRALHRQAHHDRQRLYDALEASRMEVVAMFGQSPGVVLEPELSEGVHTKALVFARRRRRHPCQRSPTVT